MKIEDTFFHNFYYSNKIYAFDYNLFFDRLKSIMTYSLVSYNYKFNNNLNVNYVQNWDSLTYGYSKDYVSLIDPVNVFIEPRFMCDYNDIEMFMRSGSYILFRRDWICSQLNKLSCYDDLFSKPLAINRDFINNYLDNFFKTYLLNKGMEYVIPGEVKIKNCIPISEICGVALCKEFVDDKLYMNLIKNILIETNMMHIPIFEIERKFDNYDNVKKLILRKI